MRDGVAFMVGIPFDYMLVNLHYNYPFGRDRDDEYSFGWSGVCSCRRD